MQVVNLHDKWAFTCPVQQISLSNVIQFFIELCFQSSLVGECRIDPDGKVAFAAVSQYGCFEAQSTASKQGVSSTLHKIADDELDVGYLFGTYQYLME